MIALLLSMEITVAICTLLPTRSQNPVKGQVKLHVRVSDSICIEKTLSLLK